MSNFKRILKKGGLYAIGFLPIATLAGSIFMLFTSIGFTGTKMDEVEAQEQKICEYSFTDEFKEKQSTAKDDIENSYKLGVLTTEEYQEKLSHLVSQDYILELAKEKEEYKDDFEKVDQLKDEQTAWAVAGGLGSVVTGVASGIVTAKKSEDWINDAYYL